MDNVFLHWAFTIFGFVFPLIRAYYLFRLIVSRRVWLKDSGLGRVSFCLLFVCLMYLWFTLPSAYMCCYYDNLPNPNVTIYRSGVPHEDCILAVVLLLTPYEEMKKILGFYALFRSLFLMVVIGSVHTADGSRMRLFCSVAAPVFTVIMGCYRLIIIRRVIKTKNVQFMPFVLCLFMLMSSASWLVFCLLERDFFAAIPNGFLTCLGAWQMFLYAKYRNLQPTN